MRRWFFFVGVSGLSSPALAQDAKKEIQKYQQMIADGSPVELFELEGEALWKKPQGPSNVSLEKCDLGQGAGVLKGAYARLPRYFKDADRVMDLETRLLHCMTTLQGRSRDEATKRVFGNDEPALRDGIPVGLRRGQSRGVKMAAGNAHPKEKEAFELGSAVLPPRRRLGLLLRQLPRRGRQAHPHAGPAGAVEAASSRARSSPPGRPTACRTASSRPCSGASTIATGRCACPSRFRLRRHRRADHFLTVTGKGEPYNGPGTKR